MGISKNLFFVLDTFLAPSSGLSSSLKASFPYIFLPRHFWLFQSCRHPMLLPLPQATPHPLFLIMESLAAITKWGRRLARVPLVSSLKVGFCLLLSSNAQLSSNICYPCSSVARNVISVSAVHCFFAFPSQSLTTVFAYLTSFDRRQSDYKPASGNKICMPSSCSHLTPAYYSLRRNLGNLTLLNYATSLGLTGH